MKARYLLWGAATCFLALIIHFSAVLAIPYLSEFDAWKRLEKNTEANQMLVVDSVEDANRLWAFHAPDIKYAICRYDVSKGPVQVDFALLRGYWSVSIYDTEGKNFYAADGYDLLREETSLVLLGPDHIRGKNQALPITVPDPEGLVVLRAPVDNQVFEETVSAALRRATCQQLMDSQTVAGS